MTRPKALADDLHRFLRDEPIYAKPPNQIERMRKWGRRHPAYVVAFIFVMFLTLIVSAASNWLISQANNRTKAALAAERIRAEEAEKRFSQARQAVDFLIEVSENDLDKPPTQPLQKRLLETARRLLSGFHRATPRRSQSGGRVAFRAETTAKSA